MFRAVGTCGEDDDEEEKYGDVDEDAMSSMMIKTICVRGDDAE